MKYLVHIFLIFYLVLCPLIPVVDYVFNYDYIAKVLCINKEKPEMLCNGKCYLAKELAKTESSQTSSKEKISVQKNVDIFIELMIINISEKLLFWKVILVPFEIKLYSFQFENFVLKPPIF